jgi:type IV pilus assembly protein PilY1
MAASEAAAAKKVLWEFSASDMGYSFGAPMAVKTAQYGWVIALTSGYNNGGSGHLYLLNPKTGALLKKMSTPTASNGLTHASAYVASYADYTADAIYAGDLNGQLWRFDLKNTDGGAALLATLAGPGGQPQPITAAPQIAVYPATSQRYVMAGTGKLLDTGDIKSTQVQSFYVIADGNANAFGAARALTRADLARQTDLSAPVDMGGRSGWYTDLNGSNTNYIGPNNAPATTSATGERVLTMAAAYSGMVAFSTMLMTPDPCLPTVGNIYAIDFGTGQTVVANNVPYLPQASFITDLSFVAPAASGSGVQLLGGNREGDVFTIPLKEASGAATRIINWRRAPVSGK